MRLWNLRFVLLAALAAAPLAAAPLAAADPEPVTLPADPQAVVVSWDLARAELPRNKEGARLVVRAGGMVEASDPHGAGKKVEAKLSAGELAKLLAFVVREQDVLTIESEAVEKACRDSRVKAGLPAEGSGLLTTIVRIDVGGKKHEIHCVDLPVNYQHSPESKRLAAIERRLAQVHAWTYAGGDQGVAAALKVVNDQLRKEHAKAPEFKAADLTSALDRANGTAQIFFERRGGGSEENPYSFLQAHLQKDSPEAAPRVTIRAALAERYDPARLRRKDKGPFNVDPTPIADDKSVKWDYPIVYVRAPRDEELPEFANTHPPTVMPPGSELMILYPDRREEVLVPVGATEAIVDPFVSFDGQWVYFAKLYSVGKKTHDKPAGSDIFKVHVATKKVVQLTQQAWTPNTGAVEASLRPDPKTGKKPEEKAFLGGRGVYNLGPCPLPGGRVAFTSDRNAFKAAPGGTGHPLAMQLLVMDDDGANVETIGHLNLGGILHPVILKDGRIIFTTNETQGLRGGYFFWGVWSIHPDGSNWGPVISAYDGDVFHFYTQLSDERIVLSNYYPGGTTRGFGTYHSMPPKAPAGEPGFGPAYSADPRNRTGPTMNSMPFKPYGLEALTVFATKDDVRPNAGFGKVTHPAGAPDNHLLTVWGLCATKKEFDKALDPFNNARPKENFDSGLYLIKEGKPLNEPGQMLLIKNDPKFHELWPRALVSYERIYGVKEPARLAPVKNDGKLTGHLPEGTPYGLVGSSSLYKRESYPEGAVPPGEVTATFVKKHDSTAFQNLGGTYSNGRNWLNQGADAGLYENSEIHAIRIVITEPVSHTGQHRPLQGHASNFQGLRPETPPSERLRILGEFPVRKFKDGIQPVDPDGNPDTSFEAKIPADVAWTFQTLDRRGLVLNMAQTWHQVRPGERRNDCGGCHAHSQKPTDFYATAASKPDYTPWDLTGKKTPLITSKEKDTSGKQWDQANETGVRFIEGVASVEYHRDVKPILERSCVRCHTKNAEKPAGNLVLDADDTPIQGLPGTYYRLAMDSRGDYGHKPIFEDRWGGYVQVSRYIRKMQSRRSLLIWKIYGERLDGWTNDDFATETKPGDASTLVLNGEKIDPTRHNTQRADLDYTGSIMPPQEAVDAGKVKPLTDEDRRTLVRWIDLGCPLDRDFDPEHPAARGRGWMLDDHRPTLTLTEPAAGANAGPVKRLLIGMHDYYTGLDKESLTVTADFALDGAAAGENLAGRLKPKSDGVFELALAKPITELPSGVITVSVKDREGNVTKIERKFSVGK